MNSDDSFDINDDNKQEKLFNYCINYSLWRTFIVVDT